MMHFLQPALDAEFCAELRAAGVLTPEIIERIDALMGRPETGTLNDFLLAGAPLIPEPLWLAWLIRRYDCYRFGRVTWHEELGEWAREGLPSEGNLPFRRGADGTVFVAMLRPDRAEHSARRWPKLRLVWAAATLPELAELHTAWRRRS